MNIGIVGCGNIAESHASILRKNLSKCRLIFCDRNKQKADRLAERFSPGITYESIDELLSAEKLDAVHILTQLSGHTTLAERTLVAGAHTYIEKPVAERTCEYTELLSLAKIKGRLLCAGYSTLGIPVVQRAKDIINSGKFGELLTVHCDFNWSTPGNAIPYGRPDHWAYSLKGGILQNLVDHPTSLVLDVMDEIQDHNVLFSRRNPLPNDCPDLVHVSVGNNHQLGSYTVSFGHGNAGGQAAYYLEAATIVVDLRRQLLTVLPDSKSHNLAQKALSGMKWSWSIGCGTLGNALGRLTGSSQRQSGISGLVRNFYRAIDGRESLIVSERTATQVLALLEQIWEEMGSERTLRPKV